MLLLKRLKRHWRIIKTIRNLLMLNETTLDSDIIEAYQATDFQVKAEQPFTLNIGLPSQPLEALYKSSRVNSATFITAFNPFSQPLSEDENRLRNAKLIDEIKQRSLKFIAGIGQDPERKWPGEDSILVLGLGLEAAKALGKHYEQNAIVWCDADAVPQLILLV